LPRWRSARGLLAFGGICLIAFITNDVGQVTLRAARAPEARRGAA
jgi:hypothetical protein